MNGGTLAITTTTVSSNFAYYGGGLWSSGSVTISDSTISENAALIGAGGGLDVSGTVTITNSTVSGNDAHSGGGISNGGTLTVANSTVSDNSVAGGYGGGGIYNGQGTLSVVDSTISGNTASGVAFGGGGIYQSSYCCGVTVLQNAVLAGNTNPGGEAPDCWGSLTSQGYSLVGDSSGCDFIPGEGDQVGTWDNPIDPLLGPLQDNAGPTFTHALLPGSPAIDTGTPTNCPATDQRGVARPIDGDSDGNAVCDIGAYEADGTEPTPTPIPTVINTPTPTFTFTPSMTPTPTATRTPTASPTATALPTATPTNTPTATLTPTASPTPTGTSSATGTPTPSATPSGPAEYQVYLPLVLKDSSQQPAVGRPPPGKAIPSRLACSSSG